MKNAKFIVLAALAAFSARAEDPASGATPPPPVPFVVACVGDSITAGGADSYPALLQKELGEGWSIRNFGVNSRTARRDGKEFDGRPGNLDYRETSAYRQSLACRPDAVILLLGTNDSKPANWEGTGEAFREGFASLAADYLALDPQPELVIGVSPTVKGGGWTYLVTEEIVGGGVAPFQRAFAAEKNLPLVDCRAVLDPHLDTAYSGDGLHPNASGRALLAGAFAAKLRELEPGLASRRAAREADAAEEAEPAPPAEPGA